MFKKIIQLFSNDKPPESKPIKYSEELRAATHLNELPQSAEEFKEIGEQFFKSRDLAQAEIYYKQSLEIKPNQFEVCKNLGVAYYYQGKIAEALNCYDKAIELKPDYPEALSNRGLALNDLNRFEEALNSLELAIKLKPDFAFAYNNQGMVLHNLNRLEDALLSYGRAISLKSDYAEAYNNRGTVFIILNKLEDAVGSFDQAIMLMPKYAEAYFNRGHALVKLKKANEAFISYSNAISLMPDSDFFYGHWIYIKRVLCDWSNYKQDLCNLEVRISNGKNVFTPLMMLTLSDSPILQKRVAKMFAQKKFPKNDDLPILSNYLRHDKIRVGYFSADFRYHAVSFLMAELFERHDKTKFEFIAFSLETDISDEMTKRIACAFDRFIDVSKQSDQEVALMSRELEIDIAIDLGGFTEGSRLGIFAMRAAPVQVNYLGYPGTMGADFIDYIIADNTIIPPSCRKYFTEKIAYLPSFQVNDTKREISGRVFTRDELGLPSVGFVFCCFNNITKIGPLNFDSWMRILKQVEGSVLWLLDENPTAVNNLRKEAVLRGVDSSRLFFAKKLPYLEYLARYRMADLFLDTLPFNAGTTASDALWAGLPVLTQIGETFAGRMAASLLNAIHLPELITTTQKDYEALAMDLATNPDKLAKIKQKLAANRLTTPLFDIEYFTKHIETAYTQMYERSQAGLAPDHIDTLQKSS